MDCVSLTRQIVWRKSLFNQVILFFSPVSTSGNTGPRVSTLDWLLLLSFPRLQRVDYTKRTLSSDGGTNVSLPPSEFKRRVSDPILVWNLMPAHDFFSFYFVSCKILWIFLGFLYSREVELPSFSLSSYISGPHSSSRRRLITLTFSSTLLFSRLDIWTGDVATKPACLRPYRSALARRFFSGNASPCQF